MWKWVIDLSIFAYLNGIFFSGVLLSRYSKSQTTKMARYDTIGTDFSNVTSVMPAEGESATEEASGMLDSAM